MKIMRIAVVGMSLPLLVSYMYNIVIPTRLVVVVVVCMAYSILTSYYCTLQNHGYVGHLLSLPDELILMVLSNLDQVDLTKCMLVCRRLFHIASDTTLCKC